MLEKTEILRMRGDREALIEALTAAGARFKNTAIFCPFHEDRSPSGEVRQNEHGVWRFRCHAGSCGFWGDLFDVVAKAQNCSLSEATKRLLSLASGAAGEPLKRPSAPAPPPSSAGGPLKRPSAPAPLNSGGPSAAAFSGAGGGSTAANPSAGRSGGLGGPPPAKNEKTLKIFATLAALESALSGRIEAKYLYRDPEFLIYRVRREDGGKSFLQVTAFEGGWVFRGPRDARNLYRDDLLDEAESVIVVEGEKCADALIAAGVIATTASGGAGKARMTHWDALAGKSVTLWPDNDPPGLAHMTDVEAILAALPDPPQVRRIDPAGLGLPPKGDAADLLASLGPAEAAAAVREVLTAAVWSGPVGEYRRRVEAVVAGRWFNAPWPHRLLTRASQALLPGNVTVVCGAPGSHKSYWMLQCACAWHREGLPWSLYDLEEPIETSMQRLMVHLCNHPGPLDLDWVKEHADEVLADAAVHADLLESIGRNIHAPPTPSVTLAQVAAWVRDQALAGKRIVVVDPVTAADPAGPQWIRDRDFMVAVKAAARESQCSVVLITHPAKGASDRVALDDLAGGAAYSRLSHCVLWLRALPRLKTVRLVSSASGPPGAARKAEDGQSWRQADVNQLIEILKTRHGYGQGLVIGYLFNADQAFMRLEECGLVLPEQDPNTSSGTPARKEKALWG